MKIGIVTFHDAANYGAVLQAYALSAIISKTGHESEFIRFAENTEIVAKTPEQIAMFKKYPRLAEKEKEMLAYKEMRDKHFLKFVDEHLAESKKLYAPEDYGELNSDYDLFIAGSDQVWNYQITGMNPVYFLEFAEKSKRNAYAASFGVEEIPANLQQQYKYYLNGFKHLSIRELSGKELIQSLNGRNAEICLDPTLLLETIDWQKIMANNPEEPPFILLYAAEYSAAMVHFAQQMAAEKGWKLIILTAAHWLPLGVNCWIGTGVVDFVSLVKNAEAVVTNSFHGLALSIRFHKVFYLYQLQQLGNRNTRTGHLLSMAGIDDPENIDWDTVDVNIERGRNASLEFLQHVLAI